MRRMSLEEQKQAELEILIAIDEICRNCHLTYLLSGGTLLGAVRHKGFIPWDDDIDIAMPRPDYERFFDAFQSIEIRERFPYYRLISYRDKSAIYPFFKVVDTRSLVIEKYVDKKYTTGVWVDIFPLDGLRDSDEPFDRNRKTMRKYDVLVANVNEGTSPIARFAKRVMKPFATGKDIYRVAKEFDESLAGCQIKEGCDVGEVMWCPKKSNRLPYKYLHPIEMEFEGRQFMVSCLYECYLSNLYGDYMQLPPEKDRVPHPCEAYWLD
jgi:lipopolysaccharide cholinephosphotransferase